MNSLTRLQIARSLAATPLAIALLTLLTLFAPSVAAQNRTGLSVYHRTDAPTGGSPAMDATWTNTSNNGLNSITIPAGGSVWFACTNSHVETNTKNFNLTIQASPISDIQDLKAAGCAGFRDRAGTNPSTTTWSAHPSQILGQISVNATFDPQPIWEYVKFDNTSGQSKTFNLKILSADSHCADKGRSTGDNGVPDSRMDFSDAMFGAENAMENNTRITEIELFPRNVDVDFAIMPTLDAPPHTGNWSAEFVVADPNGDLRPHGGVRWTTDGVGLLAGELHNLSLTMTSAADSSYVIFGFDADALDHQEILIDLWDLPWYEDFELYGPYQGLHGSRGWRGWDNDPAFDAPVTDVQQRDGAQSVNVSGTADIIREFEETELGAWSFSAWQYIPSDFVSGGGGRFRGHHFLLLNTYQDNGPYNWSVDLQVDSTIGMMKIYHGDGFNTINVPYETDRWVKIEAIIDLENDWTQVYYDDALITEYTWTGGIFGDGGGVLDIAVVDLWANGSSPVYYDDLKLEKLEPTPSDLVDFEIITGVLLGGDVNSVRQSDDVELHTRSGFGETFVDLHNMELRVSAVTSVESPASLAVTTESRISEPAGIAQIRLLNHTTAEFDLVGQYPLGNTEAIDIISGIDATNYVNDAGGGEIELSIKQIVFVPFLAFTFESWFDLVQVDVR